MQRPAGRGVYYSIVNGYILLYNTNYLLQSYDIVNFAQHLAQIIQSNILYDNRIQYGTINHITVYR